MTAPGRMLGKAPPIPGLVTPKLADYHKRALPPPPAKVDNYSGVSFQEFCNNRIGCCTVSAIANGILQRTALNWHTPVVMPDATVERIYSELTGYRPGDLSTDRGAIETDVLRWFAREGVSLRDQSLEVGTWAALDDSPAEIRQAVWLFGSAYIGLALPNSAQVQKVWDAPVSVLYGDNAPGSWGGHCTLIVGYDNDYLYNATWGQIQPMTYRFMEAYMDESYAVFSPDEWIGPAGLSPSQFDLATLQADHLSLGTAG